MDQIFSLHHAVVTGISERRYLLAITEEISPIVKLGKILYAVLIGTTFSLVPLFSYENSL
jgi:hypothetical protein